MISSRAEQMPPFLCMDVHDRSCAIEAAARGTDPNGIVLSDYLPDKAENLAAELNCAFTDNLTVAKESRYIFLGVKPQAMASLMAEIADQGTEPGSAAPRLGRGRRCSSTLGRPPAPSPNSSRWDAARS